MTPGNTPKEFVAQEEKVKNLVKDAVDKMDGDEENKLTKEEKDFQQEAFAKLNEMGVKKRLKVMIDTQKELSDLTEFIQKGNFENAAIIMKGGEINPSKESASQVSGNTEKKPIKELLDTNEYSESDLWKRFFNPEKGEIDFKGDSEAKRYIGLGDMLPPAQTWVRVDGILGKRSFAGNKVGYLNALGDYIPIYGGERVEFLSDEDVKSLEPEKTKEYESIHPSTDEKSLKENFKQDLSAMDELRGDFEKMSGKMGELVSQTADRLKISEAAIWSIINIESGGNLNAKRFEKGVFARNAAKGEAYSTSYGLFQIMGFNHVAAGFDTPNAMKDAFSDAEDGLKNQFLGFAGFLTSNSGALKALQDATRNGNGNRPKDWKDFARRYNGPGYRKYGYHRKMAKNYRRYS